MKTNLKHFDIVLFTMLILLFAVSCKKDNDSSVATITTTAVTSIDIITATSGGTITSDGGAVITERGICWSTLTGPTIADNKTSDGEDTGTFSSSITGLSPNTPYYVRAYATNSAGTAYGTEITFTTLDGVVDADGNAYHISSITSGGVTKVFMTENLRTTKYNDGTDITLVTDGTAWPTLSTGAYCWVGNDSATNSSTYGALYNWHAVNTGKLAPTGWHVTTNAEWTNLITYLGGEAVAGGKLKETGTEHWDSPNTGASNDIGFNGLPGGYTHHGLAGKGDFGYFWTSTEESSDKAYDYQLSYNSATVICQADPKTEGFSIRCIKD
jgi:uncharacterized protein (TIGR02145 family)